MPKYHAPQVRMLLARGMRPIDIARAMEIPVQRIYQIKYRDRLREEGKPIPRSEPLTLWGRIKKWLKN